MALTAANEKSTYVVTATFADEDGNSIIPDSVTWTLRNNYGEVVNSRTAVTATAGTTVTIVLSGDDLVYEANSLSLRTLVIEATYTSSYGAALPLKEQTSFAVTDILGV